MYTHSYIFWALNASLYVYVMYKSQLHDVFHLYMRTEARGSLQCVSTFDDWGLRFVYIVQCTGPSSACCSSHMYCMTLVDLHYPSELLGVNLPTPQLLHSQLVFAACAWHCAPSLSITGSTAPKAAVSGGARPRANTPVGTLLVCSMRGAGSHWRALVHI